MQNPVTLGRATLLALLDHWPSGRSVVATRLVERYRRNGADVNILREALDGEHDRAAKRTAEMIMWAAAVEGKAPFPTWFPASHHIRDPKNRERSAVALHRYLDGHPDAPSRLWRQYFLLAAPADLAEARSVVERDLSARLDRTRPNDVDERRSLEHEQQLRILRRAVNALRQEGLRPFLVSGSLLGVIRDGKLLDHDYDIDLGLLPGDGGVDRVAPALEAAGFEVTAEEQKVVAKDESRFAVDLFLHYERDGLLWHGTKIHEWWNTPFELEQIDLDGVKVWIPSDSHRYLDENYGTWDRPIAFYNFSFDTPNRAYQRNVHALLYLQRRLVTALEVGDRWTVEASARELRDVFDIDVTRFLQRTPLLEPKSAE